MKTLLVLVRNPAASKWLLEYAVELSSDLQRDLEEKAAFARESLTSQLNLIMQEIDRPVIAEVTSAIGVETTLIKGLIEYDGAHMVMVPGVDNGDTVFRQSFVEEFTREINCPVWVIPEDTKYRPLDHVIYATDYQEADEITIKKLVHMTHLIAPKITALHVTGNPDFELRIKNAGFQKVLQSRTGYDRLSVKALVDRNGGDIPGLILQFASKEKARLVVVLKENKSFLERIFSSSTSKKIVHAAGIPVLVYHANDSFALTNSAS
jgi:nucleotide-binding universal stress UspA family protein